jgi:hypothetical protein
MDYDVLMRDNPNDGTKSPKALKSEYVQKEIF